MLEERRREVPRSPTPSLAFNNVQQMQRYSDPPYPELECPLEALHMQEKEGEEGTAEENYCMERDHQVTVSSE